MPSKPDDAILSVLIPVYNEEATLQRVLDKVLRLQCVMEVIIVDDCSTDGSVALIERLRSDKIVLHHLDTNQGKTAAIARAIAAARGDILIIQDGDLEYDPDEIPRIIAPILQGHADVVYGSRFLAPHHNKDAFQPANWWANRFLTALFNTLTGARMTDLETCYKAFRAPILKHMRFTSRGFGVDIEISAMVTQMPQLRVCEVPISYQGRSHKEGKKIGLRDGIDAIAYIFYYNLIAPNRSDRKLYFRNVINDLTNSKHPAQPEQTPLNIA